MMDFYKILRVHPSSNHREIEIAANKMMFIWDPNAFVEYKEISEKFFQDIIKARDVLTDPLKRLSYDKIREEKLSDFRHERFEVDVNNDYGLEIQKECPTITVRNKDIANVRGNVSNNCMSLKSDHNTNGNLNSINEGSMYNHAGNLFRNDYRLMPKMMNGTYCSAVSVSVDDLEMSNALHNCKSIENLTSPFTVGYKNNECLPKSTEKFDWLDLKQKMITLNCSNPNHNFWDKYYHMLKKENNSKYLSSIGQSINVKQYKSEDNILEIAYCSLNGLIRKGMNPQMASDNGKRNEKHFKKICITDTPCDANKAYFSNSAEQIDVNPICIPYIGGKRNFKNSEITRKTESKQIRIKRQSDILPGFFRNCMSNENLIRPLKQHVPRNYVNLERSTKNELKSALSLPNLFSIEYLKKCVNGHPLYKSCIKDKEDLYEIKNKPKLKDVQKICFIDNVFRKEKLKSDVRRTQSNEERESTKSDERGNFNDSKDAAKNEDIKHQNKMLLRELPFLVPFKNSHFEESKINEELSNEDLSVSLRHPTVGSIKNKKIEHSETSLDQTLFFDSNKLHKNGSNFNNYSGPQNTVDAKFYDKDFTTFNICNDKTEKCKDGCTLRCVTSLNTYMKNNTSTFTVKAEAKCTYRKELHWKTLISAVNLKSLKMVAVYKWNEDKYSLKVFFEEKLICKLENDEPQVIDTVYWETCQDTSIPVTMTTKIRSSSAVLKVVRIRMENVDELEIFKNDSIIYKVENEIECLAQ